jgi:hypothetical protein
MGCLEGSDELLDVKADLLSHLIQSPIPGDDVLLVVELIDKIFHELLELINMMKGYSLYLK